MSKFTHFVRQSLAIVTGTMLLIYPVSSVAQSAGGPQATFPLFSFGDAVTGDRLNIDNEFSLRNKIPVNAPFSVLVPREDDVLRVAENAPEGPTGPYLKLSFTSKDQQLIENILLAPMTIAMNPNSSERLAALAQVMSTQIYSNAIAGFDNHTRDMVRQVTIGGLQAVEVIGRYEHPELGLMFLRIVGIPNPRGQTGVFVVSNVVASKVALTNPNDFVRTRSGVMLREFKFLR